MGARVCTGALTKSVPRHRGTPPYAWSKYPRQGRGVLPVRLHLSASGLISGTPTKAGTYPITVKCLDETHSHKTQATQELTLTVDR